MTVQTGLRHATTPKGIRRPIPAVDQARTNKPANNDKSNLEGVPKPKPTAAPRKHAWRASSVGRDGLQNYGVVPFTNLPFELFIEIAKYLCPLDLVQLGRVNRTLRELLTHRTAMSVWMTARSNVQGLPPCPENLSEPKYAALLFLEQCSTCGRAALRDMDPVLQVRLCVRCMGKVLADVESFSRSDLLLSSKDIVPTASGIARDWCLYEDAKAIEIELRERQTDNQKDLTRWINERLDVTRKRYEQSRPLAEWLKKREEERRKNARKEEIEARLLGLGWEQADFEPTNFWIKQQWMSLVCNTQPLDGQAWNKLLPCLIDHLEVNRKNRLWLARLDKLHEWLEALRGQTFRTKLATATSRHRTITGTFGNNYRWNLGVQISPIVPCGNIFRFWPESNALLDRDVPQETFELEFEAKKDRIAQLINDWRYALELSLVEMLPSDTDPIESNPPDFKLTAGSDRALEYLPASTRKLLRADAAFKVHDQTGFYPHDFHGWLLDTTEAFYDSDSAVVAKALLHSMECPNASYMQMDALKKSFLCGRCNTKPVYRTWKEIIQHYLDEEKEWQRNSTRVAQNIQFGETFTLAFTHNIDLIDVDNPLIRIASGRPKASGAGRACKSQRCNLCHKFGIVFIEEAGYLRSHLRNVHFIGDLVEGVHYQPVESRS